MERIKPMELERAEASLKAAQLCLDQRLLDSAACRAYFAMFQAAIFVLEAHGLRRAEWSHQALHAALADVLIRWRKVLPAVLAGALPSAMDIRHRADYRQPGPSQRQVQRAVIMAGQFIATIKEDLQRAKNESV